MRLQKSYLWSACNWNDDGIDFMIFVKTAFYLLLFICTSNINVWAKQQLFKHYIDILFRKLQKKLRKTDVFYELFIDHLQKCPPIKKGPLRTSCKRVLYKPSTKVKNWKKDLFSLETMGLYP